MFFKQQRAASATHSCVFGTAVHAAPYRWARPAAFFMSVYETALNEFRHSR